MGQGWLRGGLILHVRAPEFLDECPVCSVCSILRSLVWVPSAAYFLQKGLRELYGSPVFRLKPYIKM